MADEIEQLRARIAAANAARDATDAKAASARELAALRAEAAAAERAAQDAEAIVQAECEHGSRGRDFDVVDTDLGIVIVKRPHAATFKKFSDLDPAKVNSLEVEKYVRSCLVYPDGDRFDAMVETQAAIPQRCAMTCSRLAGVRAVEVLGKA